MKAILTVAISIVVSVVLILGALFAFQVMQVLQYEKNGLETRTICMRLIDFVENEKRWPKSWDELSLAKDELIKLKKSVDVEFGLELSEVSARMSRGQSVVKPKERSLDSYQTAVRELGRIVTDIVEKRSLETAD